MDKKSDNNGVVADGSCRARKAHIEKVRAEVQVRYAEQLEQAGFWRRIRLRLRIRREIKKRMEELAPPDALYLNDS